MSLTPEQQAAAYAPSSVVVTAGAGTGKTHMLAERYLYYLRERDLSPLKIVAVTFTEKAAAELRSRIRSLVTQHLPERFDLLAELEAAQISTIHALASRICQEHFQIIDIPANFKVLDDLEGKIWLNNSLSAALANLPRQFYEAIPYSLLSDILTKLLDDPYTANLSFKQGIQDWNILIARAQSKAREDLINNPIWQDSCSILNQYQGKKGDKLEAVRLSVIQAIADIEEAVNLHQAIAIIDKINLRVGSKKNWQEDSLPRVKAALTSLREIVRNSLRQGLINLHLTAVDERLKNILPALNEAYREVARYLTNLKQQSRVLTFSDLEIYALKGLKHNQVKDYYRQRWQVFLVDEFQDTNPTQAELLTILTQKTELTIVGDVKQSIYGFRRADIRVFQQFRDRLLKGDGENIVSMNKVNHAQEVILSQSFRTHNGLIDRLNQIFAPLLAENHQPLTAYRQSNPESSTPYLQVLAIGASENEQETSSKAQRQRMEATCIAEKLKQMLDNQIPVYDKSSQRLRAIEPQDIAILTRTWQPLEIYAEAIAAVGIPVAPAGGGNLLATREAKDASALLRFLCDPRDDIALIAVLRSPFFALSDRLLFQLSRQEAEGRRQKTGGRDEDQNYWWKIVKESQVSELSHPLEVLEQLLQQRDREAPSRLLQIADRLTGYTAVIANLPGAKRRLGDWQGFHQLIKELERETQDLFGVVRRLKSLTDNEVTVPRPVVALENAVSLMTVFAAKGLEWSLVVVADLSRDRPQVSPSVYFDAQWGVAVKSQNSGWMSTGYTNISHHQNEAEPKSVLYTWLEYQQRQRENAEALRLLYVAFTRARDYLILSATDPEKGDLARLRPGLDAANIPVEIISFVSEKALPPILPTPPVLNTLPPLLLNSVGSGISELPVIALTEYVRCPQRFKLKFINGHPGLGEGMATGMQIGTLVHKALEHNIIDANALLPFADATVDREILVEAITIAKQFFQLPTYKFFRDTATKKEQRISLQLGKITFNGVVDLVGHNWILDYKSDRHMQPQDHRFQLWVYAQALEQKQAHIAYLRHNYIHSFSAQDLETIALEIDNLINQLEDGKYTATPTMEKCAFCPYIAFCDFAMI